MIILPHLLIGTFVFHGLAYPCSFWWNYVLQGFFIWVDILWSESKSLLYTSYFLFSYLNTSAIKFVSTAVIKQMRSGLSVMRFKMRMIGCWAFSLTNLIELCGIEQWFHILLTSVYIKITNLSIVRNRTSLHKYQSSKLISLHELVSNEFQVIWCEISCFAVSWFNSV